MMDINVNVTVDAGPRIAPVLEMVVGEVLSRINEREAPKRRPRKEETAAEPEATEAAEEPHIEVVVLPDAAPAAEPAQAPAPEPAQAAAPAEGEDPTRSTRRRCVRGSWTGSMCWSGATRARASAPC